MKIISFGLYIVGALVVVLGAYIGFLAIGNYLIHNSDLIKDLSTSLILYIAGTACLAFANYLFARMSNLKWMIIRWTMIGLGVLIFLVGQFSWNFFNTVQTTLGYWPTIGLIATSFAIGLLLIVARDFFRDRADVRAHEAKFEKMTLKH